MSIAISLGISLTGGGPLDSIPIEFSGAGLNAGYAEHGLALTASLESGTPTAYRWYRNGALILGETTASITPLLTAGFAYGDNMSVQIDHADGTSAKSIKFCESGSENVVIAGSSIVYQIGGSGGVGGPGRSLETPNAVTTAELLNTHGKSEDVYFYGINGLKMGSFSPNITNGDEITFANGTPDLIREVRKAHPNALLMIHTAGGDITNSNTAEGDDPRHPWADNMTGDLLSEWNADMASYMVALNADTGTGGIFGSSTTFRDYNNESFEFPEKGVKPFNEVMAGVNDGWDYSMIGRLTADHPASIAAHGRPKLDLYREMLTGWEGWLAQDKIHPNAAGEAHFRDWFAARAADLLDDVDPALIPEREYVAITVSLSGAALDVHPHNTFVINGLQIDANMVGETPDAYRWQDDNTDISGETGASYTPDAPNDAAYGSFIRAVMTEAGQDYATSGYKLVRAQATVAAAPHFDWPAGTVIDEDFTTYFTTNGNTLTYYSDNPPAGLSMTAAGRLQGTLTEPVADGYSFDVRAEDFVLRETEFTPTFDINVAGTGPVSVVPPTVSPGSPYLADTLQSISGGSASALGGGTIEYQYRIRLDGSTVVIETGSTPPTAQYVPVEGVHDPEDPESGDVDRVISFEYNIVESGGTNDGSTGWQVVEVGTVETALAAATITGTPTISNVNPVVGSVLDLVAGSVEGNPTPTSTLTLRTVSGNALGASVENNQYTVPLADVGEQYILDQDASNGILPDPSTVSSAATAAVVNSGTAPVRVTFFRVDDWSPANDPAGSVDITLSLESGQASYTLDMVGVSDGTVVENDAAGKALIKAGEQSTGVNAPFWLQDYPITGDLSDEVVALTRETSLDGVGVTWYAVVSATGVSDSDVVFDTSTVDNVGGVVDPTILSSVPSHTATGVSVSNSITITFDQNVAFGTGNIILRDNDGGWADAEIFSVTSDVGAADGQVQISGAVLTINPTGDLANSIEHAIRIDATAIDGTGGGNFAGIANDTTLSFTTEAAAAFVRSPVVWSGAPYLHAGSGENLSAISRGLLVAGYVEDVADVRLAFISIDGSRNLMTPDYTGTNSLNGVYMRQYYDGGSNAGQNAGTWAVGDPQFILAQSWIDASDDAYMDIWQHDTTTGWSNPVSNYKRVGPHTYLERYAPGTDDLHINANSVDQSQNFDGATSKIFMAYREVGGLGNEGQLLDLSVAANRNLFIDDGNLGGSLGDLRAHTFSHTALGLVSGVTIAVDIDGPASDIDQTTVNHHGTFTLTRVTNGGTITNKP